ncbi:MAG: zinc-dependent alcohol dehydrogenase [Longimicrobiales bacterium]
MKAIQFNVSVPGYLLAKGLGRFTDSVVYGGPSGVSLVDREEPSLPGDDWARIEVILAGICGSDLGNISFKSSPALEPFGSFPAVLGHEILGRVVEVGPGVDGALVGQRVVVDPMLHCEVRGFDEGRWCPSCTDGFHGTCEMSGEEGAVMVGEKALSPGVTIGYHGDLPGGWGEQLIAHKRQLFPVPDELEDQVAVLVEPLSIGVHAVLRSRALESAGPVMVIGSGAIAFATIWALRTLGYTGKLVAQAKRPHEVALAKALGADQTVTPGPEARQALVDTGAKAYMPMVGDEVYAGGGFDMVFDCVGSQSSLSQSLRYASARGEVVLLGCAGQVKKLDLTFLWARELNLQGFVVYGAEQWEGRDLHTFEITLERMVADGGALDQMVTHVFPLAQYRDALRAAYNHKSSKAVKVVLQP